MSSTHRSLSFAVAALVGVCGALLPAVAQAKPVVDPNTQARYETPLSPKLTILAQQATPELSPRQENKLVGLPTSGAGSLLRGDQGTILVNLMLAPGSPVVTDQSAESHGATLVATSPDGAVATVAVQPAGLSDLAAMEGVVGIEEQRTPSINAGARQAVAQVLGGSTGAVTNAPGCENRIVSEGDTQLNAASARSEFDVDGTGLMIGVLSDSYNNLGGASADVANGELPGPSNPCGRKKAVQIQSEKISAGSDEGRAMAQAIHDLAPGATIRFATAFNGDVDFANQIRSLAAAGADVIVDDITYFNEPHYQDGIIAAAINEVSAQGVVVVSSAQNSNLRIGNNDVGSYEAMALRPSPCPSAVTASAGIDLCHDFDPGAGTDTGNGYTLGPGGSLRIILGYSEPVNAVTTDLDLFLVDKASGSVVGESTYDNINSTKKAYELVEYTNTSGFNRTYDLVVGRYGQSGTPRFRTVSSRSSSVTAVERSVAQGTDVIGPSSYGHNLTPNVVSVGAVPYYSSLAPESFSSRGPVTYCWGPVTGSTPAIGKPCQTDTIDLVATNRGANSFFGNYESGAYRFYGTSQAAPHVAAVAALIKQARPCLSPSVILDVMRSTATPISGFNEHAVGGGLVNAHSAIASMDSCPTEPWSPFESWGELVTRLYSDLMGKEPSSSVTNELVGRLGSGALTPGTLAQELRLSSDHRNNVDPIVRLYEAYFQRIPDADGLNYWVGHRRSSSRSLVSISEHFARSSEFISAYGSLTNRGFVEQVYLNVLDRPGDLGGIRFWTSQLDTKSRSRGSLMVGFSESSEFERVQQAGVDVTVVYVMVLGRAPSPSEHAAQVQALTSQVTTLDVLVTELITSREYAVRVM